MGQQPEPIDVILGTRPEIIKLAQIVDLLGPRARLIHTGQHFDPELSDVFFDQLALPAPYVHFDIGGESRGTQIGEAISALDTHFQRVRPRAVIVQGDTNTTCAAAIAANACGIPIVHIEAGLRSFDRAMPEEHNRVIVDHLADLLCAPTETNRANLLAEGIPEQRIVVTGNTVVESVARLLPDSAERARLLSVRRLQAGRFILATLHRPENVDNPEVFRTIVDQLVHLPFPVVLPLHPRSVQRSNDFGLTELLRKLVVTDPIGYEEFLALAAEAAFLISDSGGIQEEASVLKRPVIVVRRSTERPEVIGTFAERVLPGPSIGEVAHRWVDDLEGLHARLAAIPSPYGDGSASELSVSALDRLFS
jgi:UDP-N-acetylglucosamine 2-epimerase (non-hydrolysing)